MLARHHLSSFPPTGQRMWEQDEKHFQRRNGTP
jgi:hypothetical protein